MMPCGGRLQVRWLREQAAAEGARAQAQMRALTAALAQAQARSACGWPETSTNGAARARLAGCIFRLQTVPVMQQDQALQYLLPSQPL